MDQNQKTTSQSAPSDSADYTIQDEEINLFGHFQVLVNWRWFIIRTICLIGVLAVIVSLLLPLRYTATTTILPSDDNSAGSGFGALLADNPVASFALGGLDGGSADLFVELLSSRTVLDGVIDELGLMETWEIDIKALARARLKGNMQVSASDAGIVNINIEAHTPELAARMANLLVEKLDQVNQEKNITRAKNTRIFIERRLIQAREDLKQAEEALLAFQNKYMTISIEDQTRAVIEAAAQIKAEVTTREIERNVLRQSLDKSHPQIQNLQAQIDALNRQLKEMEYGAGQPVSSSDPASVDVLPAASDDLYPPISAIPALALGTIRLYREVKIQTAILELVTQQYETAKIQEARDTPTVHVLDEAVVPALKSWPKRAYIVLASVMLGFILSVFYAFISEYLHTLNQREDNRSQFQTILSPLKADVRRFKFWSK